MNSCRRRVRKIVCRICAAALLCAAAGVSAQTVDKQVDAAGHVTFADRADATPSEPTAPAPAAEAANAPVRYRTISPRRAAIIEANEAARRLAQARLARERSAAPLRHELARGTDARAVNHRYWQRQEKLRQVVEQAQLRYNETRRLQLARR